jgi:hypothetical protein
MQEASKGIKRRVNTRTSGAPLVTALRFMLIPTGRGFVAAAVSIEALIGQSRLSPINHGA